MDKSISLYVLTLCILSNLTFISTDLSYAKGENDQASAQPNSNLKNNNEVKPQDQGDNNPNKQQNPDEPKAEQGPELSEEEKHKRLLAEINFKLQNNKQHLTKHGKNLLEQYDMANMIVGNWGVGIDHRVNVKICKKFGFEDAETGWKHRFSTYNYHLCKLDQGGNGDCFFHSLAGSLRMAGYTVGKLKEMNVNNRDYNKYSLPYKTDPNSFYTHEDLRNMAAAYFVTFNYFHEGDINSYDPEKFNQRMKFWDREFVEGQDRLEDQLMIKQCEVLRYEATVIVMLNVFNIRSVPSGPHWGDAFDKNALEQILNISIILFRRDDTCALLGEFDSTHNPKAYVLMYYHDVRHFQAAGIVKIEEPEKLYTAFSREKLPDVISLLTFLDTGIQLRR